MRKARALRWTVVLLLAAKAAPGATLGDVVGRVLSADGVPVIGAMVAVVTFERGATIRDGRLRARIRDVRSPVPSLSWLCPRSPTATLIGH